MWTLELFVFINSKISVASSISPFQKYSEDALGRMFPEAASFLSSIVLRYLDDFLRCPQA